VGVHNGACLALAPDPSGAFITGGADGKLMAVGADGRAVVLGALPGRAITSVAASRSGLRAGAAGSRLMLVDPCRHSLDIPGEVGALSFDPSGRSLAVAHAAGLAIISSHGGIRRLPMQEAARALAWRPDANWLAVASGIGLSTWCASEPTMLEHRADIADIRAMAFTADGRVLAASGGARPFCWRFSESGWNADPFETGVRNRLTSVCALTGHPMRPLLAVGYENGAVMLCQPGVDQSLMVKNHGGGAVTALAWSADGTRLALGTAEGTAGLLVIPAGLLRETLSETELAE
jgi:WD40 repeat protein